jgi:hypothetical protein
MRVNERVLIDMQIQGPDVILDFSPAWNPGWHPAILEFERYGRWRILEVLRAGTEALGVQLRVRVQDDQDDKDQENDASSG